jgi:hypothetical protein
VNATQSCWGVVPNPLHPRMILFVWRPGPLLFF